MCLETQQDETEPKLLFSASYPFSRVEKKNLSLFPFKVWFNQPGTTALDSCAGGLCFVSSESSCRTPRALCRPSGGSAMRLDTFSTTCAPPCGSHTCWCSTTPCWASRVHTQVSLAVSVLDVMHYCNMAVT